MASIVYEMMASGKLAAVIGTLKRSVCAERHRRKDWISLAVC